MSNKTKAIRTSNDAANRVRDMIETEMGCISAPVRNMKITTSRVGGYVHIPIEHKDEVLDYVAVAWDVANETLRITSSWDDDYDDRKKEIADLKKLHEKIEAL